MKPNMHHEKLLGIVPQPNLLRKCENGNKTAKQANLIRLLNPVLRGCQFATPAARNRATEVLPVDGD
jgi:hypothetical protein